MKPRLRKISDQVIVITGASSGIGLTTARMAAKRGAKLVLAARNEDALRQLADEINGNGSEAISVIADARSAGERVHQGQRASDADAAAGSGRRGDWCSAGRFGRQIAPTKRRTTA